MTTIVDTLPCPHYTPCTGRCTTRSGIVNHGVTRASSMEEQHRPKVRVPSSNLGRGTASVAQRKSRGFLPHECAGSNPARGTCIMYQAEWGSSVVPASLISWSPVVRIHPPHLGPGSSAAEHRHDKPKAPGSMPGPDTQRKPAELATRQALLRN
jgi:hypothetical protein